MNNLIKTGKDFFSRKNDDNIYTPFSMITQLLENELFDIDKTVLEPACGEKLAIVNVLLEIFKSKNIFAYDKCASGVCLKDFLLEKEIFDYIITNPPYSLWDQFINQAKKITKIKFAFLGRLEFLTGLKRFETNLYNSNEFILTKVYIFIRKAALRFFDKQKQIILIENKIKQLNDHMTNDNIDKEFRLLKRLDSVKKMTDYPCLREDGKYPAGMYHFCWFIFENKNYLSKIPGVKIPDYPEIRMINNNEYILRSNDFKN
jgi:hypothetical protein